MSQGLRVALFDAYHRGSHRRWAEDAALLWTRSGHETTLWTLPGRHWKWRMHGAAAAFADRVSQDWSGPVPDALVVTEMLDAAALRGLLPSAWRTVPMAVYFHENQLTFPWSPTDPDAAAGRDRTYGWMNLASALAADCVWFNSRHHLEVFLDAVPGFTQAFPDALPKAALGALRAKCTVLHPPVSGAEFAGPRPDRADGSPVRLVWNHRWEYDKAPERFFAVVECLEARHIPFTLAVLGEQFSAAPAVFDEARTRWSDRVVAWGMADRPSYVRQLLASDAIVHAPLQEYFGYSVVEALHAGCIPILGAGGAYSDYVTGFPAWDTAEEAADLLVQAWQTNFAARTAARGLAAPFEPDRMQAPYAAALEGLVLA
jgi:glycosyltransferase involved in cell wall biosynthesis